MDHKGKGMVINDKEKETIYVDESKGDKPTGSGSSHKKRDGNKRGTLRRSSTMTETPPLLHQWMITMKTLRRKKTVNQNYSFDYSRIPYNTNARLLSISIGKFPHFDGEDYYFLSHKMCSHLFSLHPIIWEVVENGIHFDSTDNHVLTNEQIHKNAQATTVLLASLCRDEYNKVSGLDNAKQKWDTLKISHEGNDATMITKMELVEGELGRFAMIRGEEQTQTYNRLKTLVNKIQSYGSTRWTNHDKKSHTELKIFSRNIHFLEEADKILGGSLIPPEREKKILRNKKKEKLGLCSTEKNSQKQGKLFCFGSTCSRI
jgi:hypothetical protein